MASKDQDVSRSEWPVLPLIAMVTFGLELQLRAMSGSMLMSRAPVRFEGLKTHVIGSHVGV